MSDDLVEQLEKRGTTTIHPGPFNGLYGDTEIPGDGTCAEAAREIRSLRANLEEATRRYNDVVLAGLAKDAEIGRLREALERARPYVESEAVHYAGRRGWFIPAKEALALIDAALSPPQPAQEGS